VAPDFSLLTGAPFFELDKLGAPLADKWKRKAAPLRSRKVNPETRHFAWQ